MRCFFYVFHKFLNDFSPREIIYYVCVYVYVTI